MILARTLPGCSLTSRGPHGGSSPVCSPRVRLREGGRTQAGRGLPTSGFLVSRLGRPQAWISAEAGEPLGPDLCSLSLGRASCQGDDRIEFRVKGTNLVCLILSSLSLPPTFPSSLSSCFFFFFLNLISHAAIKRMVVIF